MSEGRFPHLSAAGDARMVDVSDKAVTSRSATAAGRVLLSAECVAALFFRRDVFEVALLLLDAHVAESH